MYVTRIIPRETGHRLIGIGTTHFHVVPTRSGTLSASPARSSQFPEGHRHGRRSRRGHGFPEGTAWCWLRASSSLYGCTCIDCDPWKLSGRKSGGRHVQQTKPPSCDCWTDQMFCDLCHSLRFLLPHMFPITPLIKEMLLLLSMLRIIHRKVMSIGKRRLISMFRVRIPDTSDFFILVELWEM